MVCTLCGKLKTTLFFINIFKIDPEPLFWQNTFDALCPLDDEGARGKHIVETQFSGFRRGFGPVGRGEKVGFRRGGGTYLR